MKAFLTSSFSFRGLCLVLCLVSGGLSAEDHVRTRVSITSQPIGASVIVDGQDRGMTPITLFDLAAGRHHLKLRLAGYVERDRFFNTDESPFIEKSVVLQPVKGLLLVKTDPPGATIVIDEAVYGQSPQLITDLLAKDVYELELRKPGYRERFVTLKFNGRDPLVIDEKLVLDSGVVDRDVEIVPFLAPEK